MPHGGHVAAALNTTIAARRLAVVVSDDVEVREDLDVAHLEDGAADSCLLQDFARPRVSHSAKGLGSDYVRLVLVHGYGRLVWVLSISELQFMTYDSIYIG